MRYFDELVEGPSFFPLFFKFSWGERGGIILKLKMFIKQLRGQYLFWNWKSILIIMCQYLSLVVRKAVFGVSDLVRHKPGCAITEDS